MNIFANIKKRRGSIAVESAIILPLFIIGILTLGYLIKLTMAGEGVFHALADETGKFAVHGVSRLDVVEYENDIAARAEKENAGDVVSPRVRSVYRIPYIGKGGRVYTDIIGASVVWDTPFRLPSLGKDGAIGQTSILARAFVGAANSGIPLPFSEMEKEDGGGAVWVFPRAGERYHSENCSAIERYPKERLLDKSVRASYGACELCKAGSVRDGTLVYCFPTRGRVYHTGECHIVERYVIEVGRAEARKRGYTPCMLCGGG